MAECRTRTLKAKIPVFLILPLLIGQPAISAEPGGASESEVAKLFTKASQDIMHGCGDRVWPGYNWNKLNILFAGSTPETRISITPRTGASHLTPLANMPESAAATFSFFTRFRLQYMSLNAGFLQGSADNESAAATIFGLGVHEAFHKLIQPRWKQSDTAGAMRGTEYPIQAQPRIERRMLFDHLKQAFLHPESAEAELGKAKYWFEKWSAKYPNEVKSTTDGYEGTARYVESIGIALMRLGCSADESALRQEIVRTFNHTFGAFESGAVFELDSEGYDIGGVSAMILRFDHPERDWWQEIASTGKTPLELLMDGVASTPNSADFAVVRKFRAKQAQLQTEASAKLDDALRVAADPSGIILGLPFDWHSGSYSPFGFFIDSKTGIGLAPLAQETDFDSGDQVSHVKFDVGAVLLTSYPQPIPCANKMTGWATPLPRSAVSEANGAFDLTGTKVSGHLQGQLVKDRQGKTWLCGN